MALYRPFYTKILLLGPTGWPIIGNLPLFVKYGDNGTELMKMLQNEYGDIVNLSGCYSIGPTTILLYRLDFIRELFITHGEHFSKRPANMWFINKLFKKKGGFTERRMFAGRKILR